MANCGPGPETQQLIDATTLLGRLQAAMKEQSSMLRSHRDEIDERERRWTGFFVALVVFLLLGWCYTIYTHRYNEAQLDSLMLFVRITTDREHWMEFCTSATCNATTEITAFLHAWTPSLRTFALVFTIVLFECLAIKSQKHGSNSRFHCQCCSVAWCTNSMQ